MRPLELALEGFTSFRDGQVLNFEELDLFAITGPTGSGKSSILDAMTFALYGQCMRAGTQASELVSQGATLLKVQFRFMVKGCEYRCTRTWRNRGKTVESLAALERKEGDEWVQLASKARDFTKVVEGVLGMDYDTFTRVIVLPQGQFGEFLKGDARQRHELLRQLAGMEIFEAMKERASERHRAVASERSALEAQLGGVSLPDEAEVAAKRQALAEREAAMPALNGEVEKAHAALEAESRLLDQLERLAKHRAELEAEEAKAPAIAELRDRLERARVAAAIAPARAIARAAEEAQAQAVAAEAAAQRREAEARAALAQHRTMLQAAQARHEESEPRFKARERSLLEAKGLEDQRQQASRECADAEQARNKARGQASRSEAAVKEAAARLAAAQAAASAAELSAEAAAPAGDRLEVLTQAGPWLREWSHVRRAAEDARGRLAQLDKELETARRQGRVAAEALKQADAAYESARSALEAAEKNASRHQHAAALRGMLAPGESCPVCEGTFPEPATLAPLAAGAADASALRKKLESADRSQRGAQAALTRAEAQAEQLELQREELAAGAARAESEQAKARETLAAMLGASAFDVEALERERQALAERDKAYREALLAKAETASRLETATSAVGFAEAAHTQAASALAEAESELTRRTTRLGELEKQLAVLTGGVPYAGLLEALEAERRVVEDALSRAREAGQAAQEALGRAEEGRMQAQTALASATAKAEEAASAYRQALAEAGLDEATLLASAADAREQAAWREAIDTHGHARVRLGTLVEQLAEAVGGRSTGAEAIAAKREALEAARAAAAEANAASVELRTWLALAEKQAEAAAALQEKLAPLMAEEQVYATLKDDLSAKKFQAYLLEHLQADLVVRATAILSELSDSRYVLRLVDGQFAIEDNWNGGELRKVRTLSGGETFAASLAMALALSERLSMGAELGSLFLDEGFGTLDAETLESVTQILESLRQQNRVIGVITHVRALGERLPTQIKIQKSPGGSRVLVETL